MAKTRDKDALIYSSDGSHLPSQKVPPAQLRQQEGGGVRVRKEKKGRRGKIVTVVSGLALPAKDLRNLAGELKKLCGSGGSVKKENIEIQGDHIENILKALSGRGILGKRAGGESRPIGAEN